MPWPHRSETKTLQRALVILHIYHTKRCGKLGNALAHILSPIHFYCTSFMLRTASGSSAITASNGAIVLSKREWQERLHQFSVLRPQSDADILHVKWMQFLEKLTDEVLHELDRSDKEGTSAHTVQYLHLQITREWDRVAELQQEADGERLRIRYLVQEVDTAGWARLGW